MATRAGEPGLVGATWWARARLQAAGQGDPARSYDVAANPRVRDGITNEIAAIGAASIRSLWEKLGKERYPTPGSRSTPNSTQANTPTKARRARRRAHRHPPPRRPVPPRVKLHHHNGAICSRISTLTKAPKT
jgi:hypothetical protein